MISLIHGIQENKTKEETVPKSDKLLTLDCKSDVTKQLGRAEEGRGRLDMT